MELEDIKYKYIIDLAKFFIEKHRDEQMPLNLVVRNIETFAPYITNIGYTFDQTIWPSDKPDWYKNMIEFRVQLSGSVSYLPFRLFINKGSDQTPIMLQPGTFNWEQ